MQRLTVVRLLAALCVAGGLLPFAAADVRPHAGMLRFPDVSATHIAFVYANDIWLVPRAGGVAVPLASPPGAETFPRFSPDGQTLAFVGNYDGNRDLYVIPTGGGVPLRITHHPAAETLCDWSPDGRLIYYTNGFAGLARQQQLFTVAGAAEAPSRMPEQLPVPYGTNGAISPDGAWLAYTPHSTDFRTWKRYRGGMATDIWLYNVKSGAARRITDWEGTDTLPMWHGQIVYYLSDNGPEHRLNIWSFDPATGARKQITKFTEYDVKFPAIGPGSDGGGEIVFQLGPELHLLDLKTGQSKLIEVTIPGDRPTIRPRTVDAAKWLATLLPSPTGKRAVAAARGDIWTIPAQKGAPRNLTRSSNAAERDPAWSPDGEWIAYFSDSTGEYELYVTKADGVGAPRQLTSSGADLPAAWRYSPSWSPDSKQIAFTDKAGRIYLHTIDGGASKLIDTEPWADQPRLNWSHDSNWIAYTKGGKNQRTSIWLYDVKNGKATQVTSGRFGDSVPTFDRKGDYLFFASSREISGPLYDDLGTNWIYANSEVLVCVPLRRDLASPFAPRSDEEEIRKDEENEGEAGGQKAAVSQPASQPADSQPASQPEGEDKTKDEPRKPLVIDFDGFEARAVQIPVKRGQFFGLAVNHEGKLIYGRGVSRGVDGEPAIKIFDLNDEKREEKTVVEGTGSFAISADGKKLLIRKGATAAIVDAAADQKLDKPMPLADMHVTIEPRAEWQQIFTDAWRIQRDFFYDPNMHGLDWKKLREQYGKMLADCVSREDVQYVIAEMISELNVGHAYVTGAGDVEEQPQMNVGLLGCDFTLDNGAFRISRIYRGAAWDLDARGPLGQPGVAVREGDYLLAVNRVPLDTTRDPWAALAGLGGKTVVITVGPRPLSGAALNDAIAAAAQRAAAERSKDKERGKDKDKDQDKDKKKDDGGAGAERKAIDWEEPREVAVELVSGEGNLRYRAWIEQKRQYVSQRSDDRVGYIYVPNTGVDGQNDLVRQFFGQLDKEALIIDERWNGGGQIPTRFIELLNRPITNYWARRDGNDWPWPPDSHQGPKCMLINGLAGSGGDAFPAYFRMSKLGKLIGMRTWGGLVGISGNPGLVDGGGVTAPTFAYYDRDGTWGIEGHGVDPDIEVIDDPARMRDGADPQLDAAIALMLEELQKNPYLPPKRPAYPDRTGMGIPEADK